MPYFYRANETATGYTFEVCDHDKCLHPVAVRARDHRVYAWGKDTASMNAADMHREVVALERSRLRKPERITRMDYQNTEIGES